MRAGYYDAHPARGLHARAAHLCRSSFGLLPLHLSRRWQAGVGAGVARRRRSDFSCRRSGWIAQITQAPEA